MCANKLALTYFKVVGYTLFAYKSNIFWTWHYINHMGWYAIKHQYIVSLIPATKGPLLIRIYRFYINLFAGFFTYVRFCVRVHVRDVLSKPETFFSL